MAVYTRQRDSEIEDGNTITANYLDDEFDAIVTAFSNVLNTSTGHNHDGTTDNGPKLTEASLNLSGIFINETAAAAVDVAGDGQIWVKNDTPNTLWFTNDAGTDFQVATLTGTETFTNKTIDGGSNTVTLSASAITSGTLVHERGGLEADVSAYDGLLKISGGSTSAVTVTSFAETLLDDSNAATARATLGFTDNPTYNTIFLNEQAAANADVTGDGQIWVSDGTGLSVANVPMYTDENGTDYKIPLMETSLVAAPSATGIIGSAGGNGIQPYWSTGTASIADWKLIYLNGNVMTLSATFDANGNTLILDADGDTSIKAYVDDKIDFGVGGSTVCYMDSGGLKTPSIGTTAAAANAFLATAQDNRLLLSTSTLDLKTAVKPVSVKEAYEAMDIEAISYKSISPADDPEIEHYGFGAEPVAEKNPKLVHMGNLPEDVDKSKKRPIGVQYDRVPVIHHVVIQDLIKRIEALEAEVKELKANK